MVGEGWLKQPQRRGFRTALLYAVNPELSLEKSELAGQRREQHRKQEQ